MDGLVVALRAIWWRKGASAALLLISVFATAVAAAGPVYLAAAEDSILQYALRTAPTTATGTGVEVTLGVSGRPSARGLASTVDRALRGDTLRAAYPSAIQALEYRTTLLGRGGEQIALATVAYRQGACGQVRMVAGRCVADGAGDEVMISRVTAQAQRWGVDRRVVVERLASPRPPAFESSRTLRVVGVYEPVDPSGGYWFNDTRGYFGGSGGRRVANLPTLEALLVPEAGFARLTEAPVGLVTAVLDLPFRHDGLHAGEVETLRAELNRAGTALVAAGVNQRGFDGAVVTGLRDVLDQAATGRRSLRIPMLLVIGQLLLLGWYVLYMVAAGAAEARGGEVALAKLRGLPTSATLSFGLLESVLLLGLSVPIGAAIGGAAVRAVGGSVFGPDALIGFPGPAWAAALVAAAGGVLAAALGGVATFRRPVLEQWRRAGRDVGARSTAVDAAVVVLAAAGLGELWWGGALGGGRLDVLALAAPGLLALAGALVGARLLPLAVRAALPATRGSRLVGQFVGLRQVARRPGGPRVAAVLATAFGLATFSVLGWSVFGANRHDRAATEVGAARVVTVDPYSGPDLRRVVAELDPGGRDAMAVLETRSGVAAATSADQGFDEGPSTVPLRLLAVEPDRLVAIAYWRGDFAAEPLERLAASLSAPLPPPLLVQGADLRLTGANRLTSRRGSVTLFADLTAADGTLVTAVLRPAAGGYLADGLPCVRQPCRLRRLYLRRGEQGLYPVVGSLTITALDQRGPAGGWRPVAGALDPRGWQPANPRIEGRDTGAERLAPAAGAGGAGLRVAYTAPPAVTRIGIVRAQRPVPAVVTAAHAPPEGTTALSVSAPIGSPIEAEVRHVVAGLPRGGDAGMLIALEQLMAARPNGYNDLLPNQVWLGPGAPADFPAQLGSAGIRVTGVAAPADRERELAHQGPALAVVLLLAGAAMAALLAAGGAAVNLHLLARRRAFELAAMRVLGVARGQLRAAVVVEQALLVSFSIVLGAGLGVLGAKLALPSVPEYADTPTFPPLLVEPSPMLVLAVAAGLAALLGAAVAVSTVALLRAAVPTRLRETQA